MNTTPVIFRRHHLLIASLLLAFSSWLHAEQTQAYLGAGGSQAAVFKLTWHDDGGISGNYYCPGGSGKVYQLVGSNQVKGEIILKEYSPGIVRATATCTLTKKIEDGKIVWRGVMVNHDGRVKAMYFYRDQR